MLHEFGIDKTSGEITIDKNMKVIPLMSLESFSENISEEMIKSISATGHTFQLNPLMSNEIPLKLTCVFSRKPESFKQLTFIEITIYDPEITEGWKNWSLEKELDRRNIQEAWLKKILGVPSFTEGSSKEAHMYRVHYEFKWGHITSFYDGRDGYSHIEIKYL